MRQLYRSAAAELEARTKGASSPLTLTVTFAAYRAKLPEAEVYDATERFHRRVGRPMHGGFWCGSLWSNYAHKRRVALLYALAAGDANAADDILDEIDKETPP